MEKPYPGKAEIVANHENLIISIPPKRNIFFIGFVSVFAVLYFGMCLVFMITALFDNNMPKAIVAFMLLFWLVTATITFRFLTWYLFGREVITIDTNVVEIKKKKLLFSKPKVYDLRECRDFRAVDNPNTFGTFNTPMMSLFKSGSTGAIAFDYGMQTVKIGAGIDEAEAKHIINKYKDRFNVVN